MRYTSVWGIYLNILLEKSKIVCGLADLQKKRNKKIILNANRCKDLKS